jgi:hypothetical protein
MIVVLRSKDVRVPQSESHGVSSTVTKALVPQSCVSRRGASTFVSKEVSELSGKGMKMRKTVVHDEDEAAT